MKVRFSDRPGRRTASRHFGEGFIWKTKTEGERKMGEKKPDEKKCPFQNGGTCSENCALFFKKQCAIRAIAEDLNAIRLLGVKVSKT
jgi:hypothetical protein